VKHRPFKINERSGIGGKGGKERGRTRKVDYDMLMDTMMANGWIDE